MTGMPAEFRPLAPVPQQVVQPEGAGLPFPPAKPCKQKLPGVHGAGADLHLLRRAGRDRLARIDPGGQCLVVGQDSIVTQNVGDEVVGDEGEAFDIVEAPRPPAGKGDVQVDGGELGALEEGDVQPPVLRDVAKEGHFGQKADEALGGVPGGLDQPPEVAAEARQKKPAEIVEPPGKESHQLGGERVGEIPAEQGGAVGRGETGELFRRDGTLLLKTIGESGGDGAEPGGGRIAEEERKVAGAEVDGVESEEEGDRLLSMPEVVDGRVHPQIGGFGCEGLDAGGQGLLNDAYVAGLPGDPGAGAADLVERKRGTGTSGRRLKGIQCEGLPVQYAFWRFSGPGTGPG